MVVGAILVLLTTVPGKLQDAGSPPGNGCAYSRSHAQLYMTDARNDRTKCSQCMRSLRIRRESERSVGIGYEVPCRPAGYCRYNSGV